MVDRVRLLNLALLTLLLGTAAAGAAECRIAVLGDSLTAGYGIELFDSFPRRLEEAVRERGFDCSIADAGVSGDTSAAGRARLDWVLADNPTHLLVELGGNDGLRALPVEQLQANLDAIVGQARGQGVAVMLAGMVAPPNLGLTYTNAFAAAYREVAARNGVPLYPFFLDGVATDPSLMQADRIHANAGGVREIVRRILPTVTLWLQSTGVAARPS